MTGPSSEQRAAGGEQRKLAIVFPELVSKLDYPMFIVTAAAEGERAGCLVGFATQTSVHPPRFLVCVSKSNRTHVVASAAHALGVHVVGEGDRELAELFGGETGDDTDKFERCRSSEGPAGAPLLEALPNRFTGQVLERLDLGDHTGFLLEPLEAETEGQPDDAGFQELKDIEPGHRP